MSNEIQILVPKLIKRLRLEKEMSQEDLAHSAGLDRTYISAVERGVRNITLKSLSKILLGLDIDVESFSKELLIQIEEK